MNRYIVAILGNECTNLIHASPVIHTKDKILIVHNSPSAELDKYNTLVANFDLLIDYSVQHIKNNHRYLKDIAKRRYVDCRRTFKTNQYLKIINFFTPSLMNCGEPLFRTPKALLSTGLNYCPSRNNFNTHFASRIDKNKRYVLKPELGALGTEQILVEAHQLEMVLGYFNGKENLTYAEFKDAFPEIYITDAYNNNEQRNILYSGGMMVCEYVEDIESEYRVYISGDKLYYKKRSRTKDDIYPRANMEVNEFSIKPIKNLLYDLVDNEEMSPAQYIGLTEFIKLYNFYYGSMDLYKTKSGQWGIFEFNNQFNASLCEPNFIRELTDYAITYTFDQFISTKDGGTSCITS